MKGASNIYPDWESDPVCVTFSDLIILPMSVTAMTSSYFYQPVHVAICYIDENPL